MRRSYGSIALALTAFSAASCGMLQKSDSNERATSTEKSGYDVSPEIVNTPKSNVLGSSVLEVEFGLTGKDASNPNLVLQGFSCKLKGQSTYKPCQSKPFTLSGLQNGQDYQIDVRANLQDKSTEQILVTADAHAEFKVDLSSGDASAKQPEVRSRSLSSKMQVGAEFAVEIPKGMHLTEYSTTKTTGVMSTYRILPESDPFYLGNFTCDHSYDRLFSSYNPAGEPLAYCHSTPPRSVYKSEAEFRLAYNHIEIATDTTLATAENYERMAVAIYDHEFDFMASRSRFYSECARSEIKSIKVPMINDFFAGRNPDEVRFNYCDVKLPGMNGAPETWRVGSFTDRPFDWTNQTARETPSVEMTYMARANTAIFLPEEFAKATQTRILSVLTKIRP